MASDSVPIWLTLIRIELARPLSRPSVQALGVGDEQVVADQLDLLAELVGQQLPAFEVVFRHAVLDRQDRELVGQAGQVVDHLARIQALALAFQLVLAVLEELGGGESRPRTKSSPDL
jgi:hypothetical protein